jgi:uncharacterized membrane protein
VLSTSGGVIGAAATVGAIVASVAIVEAALIPGLLIGGAAVLAPRLLRRGLFSGSIGALRQATSAVAPSSKAIAATAAHESPSFDIWRAVAKTLTYRVAITSIDFGANYLVIGELATAAGLSSLSLVAGPIAYFAHEAAWHYYGPSSAQGLDPLKVEVRVPIPGVAKAEEENSRTSLADIEVSRPLAKTITYEGVTAVSEFSVNYFIIRDVAAAAGLTAFSVLIAPFVFYLHERVWDHYVPSRMALGGDPASSRTSQVLVSGCS